MFQDDRMISILSGIVLMVVMGTIIQNSDALVDYFEESEELTLVDDSVAVAAGNLTRIDVFGNDIGLSEDQRARLMVTRNPDCGQVFVQNGALQYLTSLDCSGVQEISYGLRGVSGIEHGHVLARISGAEELAEIKAENPVAALIHDEAVSDSAPRIEPEATVRAEAPVPQPSVPEPLPPEPSILTQAEPETAVPEIKGEGEPEDIGTLALAVTDQQPRAEDPAQRLSGARKLPMPALPEGPAPDVSARLPVLPETSPVLEPAEQKLIEHGGVRALAPSAEDLAVIRGDVEAYGFATGIVPVPAQRPALSAGEIAVALADPAAPPVQIETPAGLRVPQPLDAAENSPAGPAAQAEAEVTPSDDLGQFRTRTTALLALAKSDAPRPSGLPVPPTAPPADLQGERHAALGESGLPKHLRAPARTEITLNSPTDNLAEIFGVGAPLDKAPIVDGPAPAVASLQPEVPEISDAPVASGSAGAAADPACKAAPSVTLQILPAGETDVILSAPCHANRVAELRYGGLRFAMPLDAAGDGRLTALGFEITAEAQIVFEAGDPLEFTLAFSGTDRMERVAVAWDGPAALELHAFEFGAVAGSAGHIGPENPRDYATVRRDGGGYVRGYRSEGRIGQNVQIYTFWLRRGGPRGTINLGLGVAAESAGLLAESCAAGSGATELTVLRASRGILAPAEQIRLSTETCKALSGGDQVVAGALGDLAIQR